MKLRNFLYLNTKVVEDYIAALDGYTYALLGGTRIVVQ